jgi:hypothetical protein
MAVREVSRAIAVAAFVGSYVGLALGRVPGSASMIATPVRSIRKPSR